MYYIKKLLLIMLCAAVFCMPQGAMAADIIDALNLAPFVPMVLDAMMSVATGVYEYFVGDGDGIIYILIWIFLGITWVLSLVKMYFPKTWVGFFGFSGGGELRSGKMTGFKIAENMLKPAMRAIIAALLLLQIKPVYMTQWLINPFLEIGAVYTNHILDSLNTAGISAPKMTCPADIVAKEWMSEESCNFLIQPVADLSYANNTIVKRGFEFLADGLRGLMMILVPNGGRDLLNVITGVVLIMTFITSNLFMALLVIQGIFNFGMQLILYPFHVLTYVTKSSDKWLDIWPAFSGITKGLQQLLVTMIACAFMLCINLAIVRALFRWNSTIFVTAAGGTAATNVPQIAAATGFGSHSVTWLSSALTLYLMYKIFNMTQEQLRKYINDDHSEDLYKSVKGDTVNMYNMGKKWGGKAIDGIKWLRGK